ncbi:glycosyltransferase family 4 protein [Acinetobacter sp. LF10]|uniref:glycosyltransferase family 4 protein n=1 Tax=Acinetobacter sp. LF10 TaxID=3403576 RepID=UPI003B2180F8
MIAAKKVFLIIPTLKQGGAERVISELANYFFEQNIQVYVVLLADADDFYKLNPGVNVYRLGFKNFSKLGKILSIFIVFFKLRNLLKRHKPDATLSFMDKYNIFTILSSAFLELRIFVSDRSNPLLNLPFIFRFFKKITYKYATGIIAQTSLSKLSLESLTGSKNIKVIPNPLKEVQLYPYIPRQNIILNIGRLVPEKGQKYLIDAFYQANIKDWTLIILGDGPLRKDLENQIEALDLNDRVILMGAVNNIDEWLAKSSLFVFSSISEGFPNALVEAMAAGLPCVSFDCDAGPRDIIVNGVNGFLIKVGDVDALSDTMSKLVSDNTMSQMIAHNAMMVRSKYNLQSVGDIYLKFLINLES